MLRLKKRQKIQHDDYIKNKHRLLDHEQILPSTNLQKCSICNRYFTENRLVEHQQACKLSLTSSSHYHYDSQLHRWKDLNYQINIKHNQIQSSKTYWKQKHQQFQDTIKGQYHPIDESISNDRPYQCSQCLRKFTIENARTKHEEGCSNKRQMNVKIRDFKHK